MSAEISHVKIRPVGYERKLELSEVSKIAFEHLRIINFLNSSVPRLFLISSLTTYLFLRDSF